MSSEGNGPIPTRVVYAFVIPTIRSMWRGPSPLPTAAPPEMGFDDVTYGYVPWSISRNVACAPSNKMFSPRSRASCNKFTVSATYGVRRSAYATKAVTTSSTSNVSPPTSLTSRRAATARSRTRCSKLLISRTSPTRIPARLTLSTYAGPMPFNVVPILPSPRADSSAASKAWCHGKIRCARLETFNRAVEIPRDSRASISLNNVGKSTTTPLPITGVTVS